MSFMDVLIALAVSTKVCATLSAFSAGIAAGVDLIIATWA